MAPNLYSRLQFLLLSSGVLASRAAAARNSAPPAVDAFPGAHWSQVPHPEEVGWSTAKLEAARRYSESIDTAAVVVVLHGRILSQWGEMARKFNVHSIRKSFLSALYGASVANGAIDLNETIGGLGIDDTPPSLTPLEKTARVIDLLKARSGVYHPAAYESPDMIARKPPRGSHPPRTFWYYNNWDFNVLGTIYEQCTGQSIFAAFARQIARPLKMEDF